MIVYTVNTNTLINKYIILYLISITPDNLADTRSKNMILYLALNAKFAKHVINLLLYLD